MFQGIKQVEDIVVTEQRKNKLSKVLGYRLSKQPSHLTKYYYELFAVMIKTDDCNITMIILLN